MLKAPWKLLPSGDAHAWCQHFVGIRLRSRTATPAPLRRDGDLIPLHDHCRTGGQHFWLPSSALPDVLETAHAYTVRERYMATSHLLAALFSTN